MTEYRFTVGVQYAREPHPSMPHATPNGWLAVHASSRDEARALAVAVLGREWAFDYGPETWGNDWDRLYPAGPFHTITSEPATVTTTHTCRHCGHGIAFKLDTWIAPDAGTDVENGDGIWRESCPDNHETFSAPHEPEICLHCGWPDNDEHKDEAHPFTPETADARYPFTTPGTEAVT